MYRYALAIVKFFALLFYVCFFVKTSFAGKHFIIDFNKILKTTPDGCVNVEEMCFDTTNDNNSITIYSGKITDPISIWGDTSVSNNKIIVLGGHSSTLCGAESSNGISINNTVQVENGYISDEICGGKSANKEATRNKVIVNGGNIPAKIYGGYAGDFYSVFCSEAKYNTVFINAGNVMNNVCAGFVKNLGKATNNTLQIEGSPVFSTSTILCGGFVLKKHKVEERTLDDHVDEGSDYKIDFSNHRSSKLSELPLDVDEYCFKNYSYPLSVDDAITGNTINLNTYGLEVAGLGNFENYNFLLPLDVNVNRPVITVRNGGHIYYDLEADTLLSSGSVVLTNTNINVCVQVHKEINDNIYDKEIVLIKSFNGFEGRPKNQKIDVQSSLFDCDGRIELTPTELKCFVSVKQILPETQIIPESEIATIELLSIGSDLVFDQCIMLSTDSEISMFSTVDGESSKYGKNANINSDNILGIAGFSKSFDKIAFGAFGENGRAKYNTESSIPYKEETLQANGEPKYDGVGIMGNYSFDENLYCHICAKTGQVTKDFNSNSLGNVETNYNNKSSYYGAHVGLGYGYKLNFFDLDLQCGYLYNIQQGSTIFLYKTNESINFNNITSSKIRTGAKAKINLTKVLKPFIGLMCDYEIDGNIRAKSLKFNLECPKMSGANTTALFGINTKVAGLDVGLNTEYSMGKKRGLSGNVKIKYYI